MHRAHTPRSTTSRSVRDASEWPVAEGRPDPWVDGRHRAGPFPSGAGAAVRIQWSAAASLTAVPAVTVLV